MSALAMDETQEGYEEMNRIPELYVIKSHYGSRHPTHASKTASYEEVVFVGGTLTVSF